MRLAWTLFRLHHTLQRELRFSLSPSIAGRIPDPKDATVAMVTQFIEQRYFSDASRGQGYTGSYCTAFGKATPKRRAQGLRSII